MSRSNTYFWAVIYVKMTCSLLLTYKTGEITNGSSICNGNPVVETAYGKVGAMISMPAAKGLFHKAIIQSGAVRSFQEASESTLVAEKPLSKLGLKISDAGKLRDIDLDVLMKAYFSMAGGPGPDIMSGFAPMVDDVNIIKNPFDPVANPLIEDVPLITGSNETEPTIFMIEDNSAFNLDEDSLYEMTWWSDAMEGKLKCSHGLDIHMVFYNYNTPYGSPFTGGSTGAEKVAAAMCDAWASFARNDRPDTPGLRWPGFTLKNRETMLFNEDSRVERDPFRETRIFWENIANPFM